MKKIFYMLAIVASVVAVACGGAKKAEKAEKAEKVNLDAINQSVAEIEAMVAEQSAEELAEVINARSYTLGANMGLTMKFQFADLELDMDELKGAIVSFYSSGDVEDETFLANNDKFRAFMYMHYAPYSQTKRTRDVMESNGMTEELPELPELYTEEYTKEFVTNTLGSQMGASLKDVDGIDMAWVFKGIKDGLSVESQETIEETLLLTINQMQSELMNVQREMFEKQQQKAMQIANEAKERSEAWLAEIEKQEGVKKTESGLLYRVERQGNGEFPTADTDRVTVHYEGSLQSGEVFDSSYDRDATITFGLNQVIKGWTEGLKLIDKGGEITLWIPSDLAYGERGASGSIIGPNAALKFKVELFGINEE